MKVTPCLVGLTLLFSSIYMSYMKKDNYKLNQFMNLLNEEQQKIYQKIIYERLSIYMIGMITGVCLGIYYLLSRPKDNFRLCKFLCIIYIVKLSIYYFYPKSPLMLYSLTTKEQTDAWADIYTEMKNLWKKSLVIGLIGYLILSMII